MSETIRVEWREGTPFFEIVKEQTKRSARRWGGEPTEPWGDVWIALRSSLEEGQAIDQELLVTMIRKDVSNFYTRREKPPRLEHRRISFDAPVEQQLSEPRSTRRPVEPHRPRDSAANSSLSGPKQARRWELPEREAERRELSAALDAAFAGLPPRHNRAARSKLRYGDYEQQKEIARSWGTTPQNVSKHAMRACQELRARLSGFA